MAPSFWRIARFLNSSTECRLVPGREIDADHLPLGRAQRREVVVVRERGAHVACRHAVCRHPLRVEPRAQRELPRAQDFGGLHALDRIEPRLDDPNEVVGDAVVGQHVAEEAHVHRVDRLPDLDREHRLLRLGRQLVAHRIDLRVDLGQRTVRVVIEAQRRADVRHARRARRGQVVDALRLRDRGFQRLGDESGDRRGIGAVIGGGDGDHRILRLGKLADGQVADRAQSEHQDQQADRGREHGLANEDVGEVHGAVPSDS